MKFIVKVLIKFNHRLPGNMKLREVSVTALLTDVTDLPGDGGGACAAAAAELPAGGGPAARHLLLRHPRQHHLHPPPPRQTHEGEGFGRGPTVAKC